MNKKKNIQVSRELFIETINEISLDHAMRPKEVRRANDKAQHLVAVLSGIIGVSDPEAGKALFELTLPD